MFTPFAQGMLNLHYSIQPHIAEWQIIHNAFHNFILYPLMLALTPLLDHFTSTHTVGLYAHIPPRLRLFFIVLHRMALAVKESGKISLEHAQTASRQMQEGNFRSARATLAKAEVSTVNHKEQISYLVQRYNAVQEHYIQKEKELTRAISDVFTKERSLESQKADAQRNLYHQEKKLNEHKSALRSAECNHSEARRKSRDANTGKIVSGIAVGLLAVATFGAAAPLVAIPFVFAELEKDAERKVEHFKNQIRNTERKIEEVVSDKETSEYDCEQLRPPFIPSLMEASIL